ncbi:hypothetical protein C7S14_0870 [Burkholderia cepacia]|nr:hypothetical protein C7S14_0870 [Burkholderia cepacia]
MHAAASRASLRTHDGTPIVAHASNASSATASIAGARR